MKKLYGVDIEEQRKKLIASDFVAPFIKEITEIADSAAGETYEALKLSDYNRFYETGDRKYFERAVAEMMAVAVSPSASAMTSI